MNQEAIATATVQTNPGESSWHISIPLWLNSALPLIAMAVTIAAFYWLWNTTMPEVFGMKKISVWQAVKLLLISAILLGAWQRWI